MHSYMTLPTLPTLPGLPQDSMENLLLRDPTSLNYGAAYARPFIAAAYTLGHEYQSLSSKLAAGSDHHFNDELRCRYPNKHCGNHRAHKRDGNLHTFCEFHRKKANQNQRRLEQRRRLSKQRLSFMSQHSKQEESKAQNSADESTSDMKKEQCSNIKIEATVDVVMPEQVMKKENKCKIKAECPAFTKVYIKEEDQVQEKETNSAQVFLEPLDISDETTFEDIHELTHLLWSPAITGMSKMTSQCAGHVTSFVL